MTTTNNHLSEGACVAMSPPNCGLSTAPPYYTVGHRGYPQLYPENSLAGIVAALELGADGVECDVQLTADLIPVVIHDCTSDRTSDGRANILTSSYQQLQGASYHEPDRLGDRYMPTPLISLEDLCAAISRLKLSHRPKLFIEAKEESIAAFGIECVLKKILGASECLVEQRVAISFSDSFVARALALGIPAGWVLHQYDLASLARAQQLQVPYLICNYKKMAPQVSPWSGCWQWFIYDVIDGETARQWANKGIKYIESWDVAALIPTVNHDPGECAV